jgi:hypothetical protein
MLIGILIVTAIIIFGGAAAIQAARYGRLARPSSILIPARTCE